MVSRWNQMWRLFFLRSSRNARFLDGIGFYHVMVPLLNACNRRGADVRDIARRHLSYFNANPILASYIAGVVTNMEERRYAGEAIRPEQIEQVKGTLSSVLTARGDYFFDVILIPLGLTIGSIFAIYSSYIGPVVFLAFYNLYHFQSRIGGYIKGVRWGEGIGRELVTQLFREQRLLGGCAAFTSGLFAALVFTRASELGGMVDSGWGVVAAAVMFGLPRKVSFMSSVVIVLLATVIYLIVT
ncbi:MAG TPA: PTS system mannose/fructose/sorbose family transporter subunit IID [Patescibacteria group bacterium]|nr:PTS system mannose/fructose/sorbose family transporter subunit IID [Patescibacteria group bacterium]